MSEEERKTYNQRKALDNRLCRARKGETLHFIYNLFVYNYMQMHDVDDRK